MTFTAAQLLANDDPGPANEEPQTLTITGVRTTAASHGTATFANGVISYVPEAGFFGSASLFYTACDNGATNGQPDPLLQRRHDHDQRRRQSRADGDFAVADDGRRHAGRQCR